MNRPKISRRITVLSLGVAGVVAETVASIIFKRSPDPTLVLGFFGLIGTPIFFPQDKDKPNDPGPPGGNPPAPSTSDPGGTSAHRGP